MQNKCRTVIIMYGIRDDKGMRDARTLVGARPEKRQYQGPKIGKVSSSVKTVRRLRPVGDGEVPVVITNSPHPVRSELTPGTVLNASRWIGSSAGISGYDLNKQKGIDGKREKMTGIEFGLRLAGSVILDEKLPFRSDLTRISCLWTDMLSPGWL
ncbi:hypothetical protein GEV33_010241 [Tenebrio molitor]|uniref:Uncharacterized protein n=1 Tax=Tenebrio molitor TaxID=7067 RepID=A0A8J6HDA2_TENMO|nr:hypothetical protein GEV33_010241 [Tenebrio molitor]